MLKFYEEYHSDFRRIDFCFIVHSFFKKMIFFSRNLEIENAPSKLNVMQDKPKSPEDYINQGPEERKDTFRKLRKTINNNLPEGYIEGIQYGMIFCTTQHLS